MADATSPAAGAHAARHRAHRRAVAHGAAHGDRERLRVQHARRGARRAQHDVARAGARGGRRRGRAHGVRAVAPAQSARRLAAPTAQPHTWNEGDVAHHDVGASTSPPASTSTPRSDALLKGLLQNVGGLDPDAARRACSTRSLDWRDADDLKRPNGAEDADYRAAGSKYVPTNAPFDTVGELQRVLGVTPELDRAHRRQLTVYSRQPGDQHRDRLARRAARDAERDARDGRRLSSRSATTRSRTSCRVPPLPAGAGLRERGGAGLADPAPRRRCPMV